MWVSDAPSCHRHQHHCRRRRAAASISTFRVGMCAIYQQKRSGITNSILLTPRREKLYAPLYPFGCLGNNPMVFNSIRNIKFTRSWIVAFDGSAFVWRFNSRSFASRVCALAFWITVSRVRNVNFVTETPSDWLQRDDFWAHVEILEIIILLMRAAHISGIFCVNK